MATYETGDNPDRLDIDDIWNFLSKEAYWNRWRTRTQVEAQIANAWRVVGLYVIETGEMVGFARAISDGVSDAYLGDVYVETEHRGNGHGTKFVSAMINEGPGAHLRWFLTTGGAHGFYDQFGFEKPNERTMVRPGSFPVERPDNSRSRE